MPYDPNQPQPPPTPARYPQPGDPGSSTKTWRTLNAPQRDWSKPGIQWLPPSYTTSSMTSAPLPGAAMTPAFAPPPKMSDRGDVNDMLGQQPETAFLQPGPAPSPTPTPTPAPLAALGGPVGLVSPAARLGQDYYKSLYGRQ